MIDNLSEKSELGPEDGIYVKQKSHMGRQKVFLQKGFQTDLEWDTQKNYYERLHVE